MLYVARVLHLPDGGTSRNMVLDVTGGVVGGIWRFDGELQSMALVDDVYLSDVDSLRSLADIRKISRSEELGRLYAYRLSDDENLQLIVD